MRVSVIVPTYNERKSLKRVVEGVVKELPHAEIVVVDDNSPDGTGRLADELAQRHNIEVVHRPGKLGLSSAVAAGFEAASGGVLGVMDADLSHPPEMLPKLVEPIDRGEADFVIGSRNVAGGAVEEWPFFRKLVSWGATLMARMLTEVKDPMSGLFFLKKDVIKGVQFQSRGYKICLEIIVKGHHNRIIEVPYLFLDRMVGSSKLGFREYYCYAADWLRLLRYKLIQ
jgi:dolichol-phosphate mannosyltransferase